MVEKFNEIVPFPRLCMNNPNDIICFPLVIKPKRIGKTPITYIDIIIYEVLKMNQI